MKSRYKSNINIQLSLYINGVSFYMINLISDGVFLNYLKNNMKRLLLLRYDFHHIITYMFTMGFEPTTFGT